MINCSGCGHYLLSTETGYYCPGCGSISYGTMEAKDIFEQISQERTMGALREQERRLALRLDRHNKRASDNSGQDYKR